eukprot:scaffold39190_cov155-Skeletonema_dohrnii-CCMP3373.AAC.1
MTHQISLFRNIIVDGMDRRARRISITAVSMEHAETEAEVRRQHVWGERHDQAMTKTRNRKHNFNLLVTTTPTPVLMFDCP